MSDIENRFYLKSDLSIDEVATLFDGSTPGASWVEFKRGGRDFEVFVPNIQLPIPYLDDRAPDLEGFFQCFVRGTNITEAMIDDEVTVIATFASLKDRVTAGFYGNEDFPFVKWDWQDYGVRFNSHPQWWHRVESRVLRRQLQEANIPFQARKLTARPARCGLRWWPEGAEEPVRLWAWYRIGADELRASLDLLAATLSTAGPFVPYRREPNSYNVEIEALEELIHQIVTTAETEPSRLAVVPQWPDALTKALALLINCGRPLPTSLTGRWEATVADAEALAPQLLENPKPLV